jgi:hypothetical protein
MTQNRTLDLSPTRFRNSSTTQSRVDSARNASLPAATQAMERVMVSIHRRDEVFAHFQRSFVRNGGLRYRLLCFFLIVNALSILGRDAIAAEQKANPITGYQLVIMPPNTVFTSKFFLGWIRLVNGQEDAGYIYLDDAPPQDPALIGTYIVTSMPTASLPMLLDILRNEKPIQIRFYDPQSGNPPIVSIEPAKGVTTSTPFHLNNEMSTKVKSRLNQK